ncbi:MAG: response regulator transcription factor [Bacteroidia bacterium]|nr:response regulator transcription factor [Bacteroidia bacterium]
MKILIVDDEADIREILDFNITAAGYDCIQAGTAEQALALVRKGEELDLILLDVMLPGLSGFQLASLLRKEGRTVPIIFLTARGAENDLLTGFSAGGDDYISKPFSINEVIARIKAVIKRTQAGAEPKQQKCLAGGGIIIDGSAGKVLVDGDDAGLSHKEYEIVSLLVQGRGRSFTREDIISELWKDAPYVLPRTVDVHISRVRTKLGRYRDLIVGRAGFGYSIDEKYYE